MGLWDSDYYYCEAKLQKNSILTVKLSFFLTINSHKKKVINHQLKLQKCNQTTKKKRTKKNKKEVPSHFGIKKERERCFVITDYLSPMHARTLYTPTRQRKKN